MATTAIWKVKGNLGRVVGYAANPDKTENPAFTAQDLQGLRDVMDYATQDYKTERQHYVSGINCAPEIARDEMQMVKQQYGKEGGIIAFHGYQSFAPGEVTPEQAHEIGVELARRLWGDRFQIVVATHLDREHIHNHFVLNSVSFVDGKKYNDCKATYALMRQTSDRLCREHGLSVIENPEQGRTMSRDTWEAEQKGKPTWYSQIWESDSRYWPGWLRGAASVQGLPLHLEQQRRRSCGGKQPGPRHTAGPWLRHKSDLTVQFILSKFASI